MDKSGKNDLFYWGGCSVRCCWSFSLESTGLLFSWLAPSESRAFAPATSPSGPAPWAPAASLSVALRLAALPISDTKFMNMSRRSETPSTTLFAALWTGFSSRPVYWGWGRNHNRTTPNVKLVKWEIFWIDQFRIVWCFMTWDIPSLNLMLTYPSWMKRVEEVCKCRFRYNIVRCDGKQFRRHVPVCILWRERVEIVHCCGNGTNMLDRFGNSIRNFSDAQVSHRHFSVFICF